MSFSSATQRGAGMPRCTQCVTVDGQTPAARAKAAWLPAHRIACLRPCDMHLAYNAVVLEHNACSARGARKPVPKAEAGNMAAETEAEAIWREGVKLRLRALLVLMDLTNKEIAAGLGVTESRVSNWLQGIAVPPTYLLHLLHKRFGVSLDYLLCEDLTKLDVGIANSLARGPKAAIEKRRPDLLKADTPP